MCHCIVQYYAACNHVDVSLTTVIHCEDSMNENYDCHLGMNEWFIPRFGVCHDCKYEQNHQNRQRKCRISKHRRAASSTPPPAKVIADSNENAGSNGTQSHGPGVHAGEESYHERENQLVGPGLCSAPPSTPPDSSRKIPRPSQPVSKRRGSSIPVPKKLAAETRVRRSLIPLPKEKTKRQSIVAGGSQELLDDLQVFDRVTF